MLQAFLAAGAVLCALLAVHAQRLLASALWLAGVSACAAALLYSLGAAQVAVIELSVGTGLVTVLFVFAIGIAGEDAGALRALVPRPLAWALVILSVILLGMQWWPLAGVAASLPGVPLGEMIWKQRALDILVQTTLLYAGVVGILGLLSEAPAAESAHAAHAAHGAHGAHGAELGAPVDTWTVETAAPELQAVEHDAQEVHS